MFFSFAFDSLKWSNEREEEEKGLYHHDDHSYSQQQQQEQRLRFWRNTILLSAWLFFSAATAAALCSRSIQFNSIHCVLFCVLQFVNIFLCIHSWKCAHTQPKLTRQTSQETFARCLSFFSAQRILHLIFVLDFMLCFFFVHVRFFRTVFNLICNNTLQSGWYVWKVDSIRLMSFCHSKIKFTLLL